MRNGRNYFEREEVVFHGMEVYMRVLFAAAEAMPFSKTGGLADVMFALPRALRKLKIKADVILPKSFPFSDREKEQAKQVAEFDIFLGWRKQHCILHKIRIGMVSYYLVENSYYFDREQLYGHYDEAERFLFFSEAVLKAIQFIPHVDILHLNDWHTGMIPILKEERYRGNKQYDRLKIVYTIHNLKYQGVFGSDLLGDVLCISPSYYHEGTVEFFGNLNFMKAGIERADIITTVSETYAKEIQYDYFGEHLGGILKANSHKLYGITNGIDVKEYNPKDDPHIFTNYDWKTKKNKKKNKVALQEELKIPVSEKIPLISMVTRLVDMKGLELLEPVLEEVLQEDVQMVILGTGEERYHEMLKAHAKRHPNKLKAVFKFDLSLAQKIYAGSDMFLMPSKFEPCGLSQLISMRYGTIPIVRETGGLKDTVRPYNHYTKEGRGFTFSNYNAHEMKDTIKRALTVYQEEEDWASIVDSAMKADVSWKVSAEKYLKLYQSLMEGE